MPSLNQSPESTKHNLLQQELDEQKLLNNNLLQEIANLNGKWSTVIFLFVRYFWFSICLDIINSRQKVEAEPQEKTEPEIENQRNSIKEDKEGDNEMPVQNNQLIDLKKEFTFIKSKMLLIEAETKQLIR